MFPVEEMYPPVSGNVVKAAGNLAFELHLNTSLADGDILVFVGSQADCEGAKASFTKRLSKQRSKPNAVAPKALVLALYGFLSSYLLPFMLLLSFTLHLHPTLQDSSRRRKRMQCLLPRQLARVKWSFRLM